ncbi:PPR domain-containing protein/PPR_1 domain-containing protein/PPR_2 domain-containing protein/PPR_3 domain-containing protein [Cephalotus follicularis]|uniref:PPR domain-containing protein/PPR_1 domain-containing protein/PPR_2 domain-containing protein/PPR_3 domain-containing protein n=1 Tax=Cephalotus follicularis TaxID=3775 RepID=A0A1Q3ARV0_CEPFO|nr:PPR domain-containing protein/PPR_1 domain-containing protein/PPR_2 domain-containing protein/PPR_3 domain-containing protein [Cephalotus follicularis]
MTMTLKKLNPFLVFTFSHSFLNPPLEDQIIIPILCTLKILYHSTANHKMSITHQDYSANSTVARSNCLITSLSRQGRILEARKLFDEMPDRDVVTWTTVITGYIKCGLIEEARKLFYRADAIKNVVTWTAMVSGYVRSNRIKEAERVFNEMPVKNVVSWNTMIDAYVRNEKVDKAVELFEKMTERNVVSWNTVIAALGQHGRMEEARRLFDRMPQRDVITWTAMIVGLARNGRIDEAREVFERMPDRNVVSWNAMITGYARNMMLNEAFELFERMTERDLPSWNTMITGFIQNGELGRALELFNKMPCKNVISWTTMITGYVKGGQSEEALQIFRKMLAADGMRPNVGTFVSALGACSDLAGLSEGQQVHQIIGKTVYQDNAFVVSALINMYSKCGELGIARKMFGDGLICQRDLVSWNGMIAAYAHHGCGREAISLFNEMQSLGLKPNDVTYVGLLFACSHSGLVNEGLKCFDELVRDSSIQLREDHYACLVDLCCRAGRVKEAFDFIGRLGIKPSESVWGALLAGCHVHGDVNIGKVAAKELLDAWPENAGTYLLLSNIYASAGRWREATKVRLKMKGKGLKKQPGCSWVEVANKVHVCVVRDKSHCQSKHIFSVLCDLHAHMKKTVYVPNHDNVMDTNMARHN